MTRSTFYSTLLFFFASLVTISIPAQQPVMQNSPDRGRTFRLFLIGNSFSQNASRYLPQLTAEGGHKLEIGRAELGGCPLQRHWESVEAERANPNDPKGKPYKGKSLKTLLSEGTWDVVTIQQYSMISGDEATYQPYAKNLYDFIHALQPNAKIVFHETWPYRADAEGFGLVNGKIAAKDQQEMYEKLSKSYKGEAKRLGIDVIPNGDAFQQVNTDPHWMFKKDTVFNYKSPTYPQLPDQKHSLNVGYTWNNSKQFTFDSHHANAAGCYLGGLVWYGFLFKESPEKLHFKPAEVDEEFAAHLRKTAAKFTKN